MFSTPPAAYGGRRLVVDQPVARGQFLIDLNEERRPFLHYQQIYKMMVNEQPARAVGEDAECDSVENGDPLQVSPTECCLITGVGIFANHSCEPSAVVRGLTMLYALRDLAAGDEVTYDYSTVMGAMEVFVMDCLCGSVKCRGKVTPYWTVPEKLRGEAQPWVTSECHVNVKQQVMASLASLDDDIPTMIAESDHWPWKYVPLWNEVVPAAERIEFDRSC